MCIRDSPILNGWEVHVELAWRAARDSRGDHPRRVPVDVREGLDESLRVAGWDACVVLRDRRQVVVATLVDLLGPISGEHGEVIRVLLAPAQSRFRSVHTDPKPVFLTGRDLRGVDDSARAAAEMHEDVRVVLELVSVADCR